MCPFNYPLLSEDGFCCETPTSCIDCPADVCNAYDCSDLLDNCDQIANDGMCLAPIDGSEELYESKCPQSCDLCWKLCGGVYGNPCPAMSTCEEVDLDSTQVAVCKCDQLGAVIIDGVCQESCPLEKPVAITGIRGLSFCCELKLDLCEPCNSERCWSYECSDINEETCSSESSFPDTCNDIQFEGMGANDYCKKTCGHCDLHCPINYPYPNDDGSACCEKPHRFCDFPCPDSMTCSQYFTCEFTHQGYCSKFTPLDCDSEVIEFEIQQHAGYLVRDICGSLCSSVCADSDCHYNPCGDGQICIDNDGSVNKEFHCICGVGYFGDRYNEPASCSYASCQIAGIWIASWESLRCDDTSNTEYIRITPNNEVLMNGISGSIEWTAADIFNIKWEIDGDKPEKFVETFKLNSEKTKADMIGTHRYEPLDCGSIELIRDAAMSPEMALDPYDVVPCLDNAEYSTINCPTEFYYADTSTHGQCCQFGDCSQHAVMVCALFPCVSADGEYEPEIEYKDMGGGECRTGNGRTRISGWSRSLTFGNLEMSELTEAHCRGYCTSYGDVCTGYQYRKGTNGQVECTLYDPYLQWADSAWWVWESVLGSGGEYPMYVLDSEDYIACYTKSSAIRGAFVFITLSENSCCNLETPGENIREVEGQVTQDDCRTLCFLEAACTGIEFQVLTQTSEESTGRCIIIFSQKLFPGKTCEASCQIKEVNYPISYKPDSNCCFEAGLNIEQEAADMNQVEMDCVPNSQFCDLGCMADIHCTAVLYREDNAISEGCHSCLAFKKPPTPSFTRSKCGSTATFECSVRQTANYYYRVNYRFCDGQFAPLESKNECLTAARELKLLTQPPEFEFSTPENPYGCWINHLNGDISFNQNGDTSGNSECPIALGNCWVICKPKPVHNSLSISTWEGCFFDDTESRAMVGPFKPPEGRGTPVNCYIRCAKYSYFGIQYNDQGVRECWCSNKINSISQHGEADNCNQCTSLYDESLFTGININCVYSRKNSGCSINQHIGRGVCAESQHIFLNSWPECEAACISQPLCRFVSWDSTSASCEHTMQEQCTMISSNHETYDRKFCDEGESVSFVKEILSFSYQKSIDGGGKCGARAVDPEEWKKLGWCGYSVTTEGLCVSVPEDDVVSVQPFRLGDGCFCENELTGLNLGACSVDDGLCKPVTAPPTPIPTERPTPPPLATIEGTFLGDWKGIGFCVDKIGTKMASYENLLIKPVVTVTLSDDQMQPSSNGGLGQFYLGDAFWEMRCREKIVQLGKLNCDVKGFAFTKATDDNSISPICSAIVSKRILEIEGDGEWVWTPSEITIQSEYPVDGDSNSDSDCYTYTGGPCSQADSCAACYEANCVFQEGVCRRNTAEANICTSDCFVSFRDSCDSETVARFGLTVRSASQTKYEDLREMFFTQPVLGTINGLTQPTDHDFDFVYLVDKESCEAAGYLDITLAEECKVALCGLVDVTLLIDVPNPPSSHITAGTAPLGCSVQCSDGSGAFCSYKNSWFQSPVFNYALGNPKPDCRNTAKQNIRCVCKRDLGPVLTPDENCLQGGTADYVLQEYGPGCGTTALTDPSGKTVPSAEVTDVISMDECRKATCSLLGYKLGDGNSIAWNSYPVLDGDQYRSAYSGAGIYITARDTEGVTIDTSVGDEPFRGGCSAVRDASGNPYQVFYLPQNVCPFYNSSVGKFGSCNLDNGCQSHPDGSCTALREGFGLCTKKLPCLCRRLAPKIKDAVIMAHLPILLTGVVYDDVFNENTRSVTGKAKADSLYAELHAIVSSCLSTLSSKTIIPSSDGFSGGRLVIEITAVVPENTLTESKKLLEQCLSGTLQTEFQTEKPSLTDDSQAVTINTEDIISGYCPIQTDFWGSGTAKECNPCTGSTASEVQCGNLQTTGDTVEQNSFVEVSLEAGETQSFVFNAYSASEIGGEDVMMTVKKHQRTGGAHFGVMIGDNPVMDFSKDMFQPSGSPNFHCRSKTGTEYGTAACTISACGVFKVSVSAIEAATLTLSLCYQPRECPCDVRAADDKIHGKCVLARPKRTILNEATGEMVGVPSVMCECDVNFGRISPSGEIDCTQCSPGRFPAPNSAKWKLDVTEVNLEEGESPPCALVCGRCGEVDCGTYNADEEQCACEGELTGPTCEDSCKKGFYGTFCDETYNALEYQHEKIFDGKETTTWNPPPWDVAPNSEAVIRLEGISEKSMKTLSISVNSDLVRQDSTGANYPPKSSENLITAAFYAPEPSSRLDYQPLLLLHIFQGDTVTVYTQKDIPDEAPTYEVYWSSTIKNYYEEMNFVICQGIFGENFESNIDDVIYYRGSADDPWDPSRENIWLIIVVGDKVCTATGYAQRFVSYGDNSISSLFLTNWEEVHSLNQESPVRANPFDPNYLRGCEWVDGAENGCLPDEDERTKRWTALSVIGGNLVLVRDGDVTILRSFSEICCIGSVGTIPCQCSTGLEKRMLEGEPFVNNDFLVGEDRKHTTYKIFWLNQLFENLSMQELLGGNEEFANMRATAIASAPGYPTLLFDEFKVTFQLADDKPLQTFTTGSRFPNLGMPANIRITEPDDQSEVKVVHANVVAGEHSLYFKVRISDGLDEEVFLQHDTIEPFLLMCADPLTAEQEEAISILGDSLTNPTEFRDVLQTEKDCEPPPRGIKLVGDDSKGVIVGSEGGQAEFVFSYLAINRPGRFRIGFRHVKTGIEVLSGQVIVQPTDCESPLIWSGAEECQRNCLDTSKNPSWNTFTCIIPISSNKHWIQLSAEALGRVTVTFTLELVQTCCDGKGLCCNGMQDCYIDENTDYVGTAKMCSCYQNPTQGFWDQRHDCTKCKTGFSGESCAAFTGLTKTVEYQNIKTAGSRDFIAFSVQPETVTEIQLRSRNFADGGDADLSVKFISCPGQTDILTMGKPAHNQIAAPCSARGTCHLDYNTGKTYCECYSGYTGDSCTEICCSQHGSCSSGKCECYADSREGFWAPAESVCGNGNVCSHTGGADAMTPTHCLFTKTDEEMGTHIEDCTETGETPFTSGKPARLWISWREVPVIRATNVKHVSITLPLKGNPLCRKPQKVFVYATKTQPFVNENVPPPNKEELRTRDGEDWIDWSVIPCNMLVKSTDERSCTTDSTFQVNDKRCHCDGDLICVVGRCIERNSACDSQEDPATPGECRPMWMTSNSILPMVFSNGKCVCKFKQLPSDEILLNNCENGICLPPLNNSYSWEARAFAGDPMPEDEESLPDELKWSGIDPTSELTNYHEIASFVSDETKNVKTLLITDWYKKVSRDSERPLIDISFVIVTESDSPLDCQPSIDSKPNLILLGGGRRQPSRIFLSMKDEELSNLQDGHPFYKLFTADVSPGFRELMDYSHQETTEPTVFARNILRYQSTNSRKTSDGSCGSGECACSADVGFQDPVDFTQIGEYMFFLAITDWETSSGSDAPCTTPWGTTFNKYQRYNMFQGSRELFFTKGIPTEYDGSNLNEVTTSDIRIGSPVYPSMADGDATQQKKQLAAMRVFTRAKELNKMKIATSDSKLLTMSLVFVSTEKAGDTVTTKTVSNNEQIKSELMPQVWVMRINSATGRPSTNEIIASDAVFPSYLTPLESTANDGFDVLMFLAEMKKTWYTTSDHFPLGNTRGPGGAEASHQYLVARRLDVWVFMGSKEISKRIALAVDDNVSPCEHPQGHPGFVLHKGRYFFIFDNGEGYNLYQWYLNDDEATIVRPIDSEGVQFSPVLPPLNLGYSKLVSTPLGLVVPLARNQPKGTRNPKQNPGCLRIPGCEPTMTQHIYQKQFRCLDIWRGNVELYFISVDNKFTVSQVCRLFRYSFGSVVMNVLSLKQKITNRSPTTTT